MAGVLGKRRRVSNESKPSPPASNASDSSAEDRDELDVFRRAFEAKFKPLDTPKQQNGHTNGTRTYESYVQKEESDWEGFDSDASATVEVIEHSVAHAQNGTSKVAARAFMTSKPPTGEPPPPNRKGQDTAQKPEEAEDDKLNLQNDLALQRLINESHILDETKDRPYTGQRRRLLDQRLQSLGATPAPHGQKQQNMPLSHRRGIAAKAAEREDRRRRDAKENGIVLERAAAKSSADGKKDRKAQDRRVRAVGGPSVGKFKGGTLRLSRRDVAAIRATPGSSTSAGRNAARKRGR